MFHFRGPQPTQNWPSAVMKLSPNYSIKAVDNVQQLAEAKWYNSDIIRILRHFTYDQVPGGSYPQSRQIARDWLKTFIDGTFLNGSTMGVPHKTTEYIEDFNEYGWAPSQSQEEKEMWATWAIALLDEWYETYWNDLGTNLIIANIPVGNDIELRVVERIAFWTDVSKGMIPRIGYHSYWPVAGNHIYDEERNWRYYSGRFSMLDEVFQRAGLTVHWALTEAGALGYHLDPGGTPSLHPNDGWRLPSVHNGNINEYLSSIDWFMTRWYQWNLANNWRCLSPNLFDTMPNEGGAWLSFQIHQPNLDIIADFCAQRWQPQLPSLSIPPVEPPPPNPPSPSDNFMELAWQFTENLQKIGDGALQLNALAAIQQAVSKDNKDNNLDLQVVTTERMLDNKVVQAAESLSGKVGRRVYVWESGKEVYWFENPFDIEFLIIDITPELLTHETEEYDMRHTDAITTLTIHHTVGPSDQPVGNLAQFHVMVRDWPGIGYHFVINGLGTIYQTNWLSTVSYHAANENYYSVGIALQGDFTDVEPSKEQQDAAKWLISYLKTLLGRDLYVVPHREMPGAQTACPGNTYLNWIDLLQ